MKRWPAPAPFTTMRREPRSSLGCAAKSILRRHKSKPKFAAAVNVAQELWIARSQAFDRTTRLSGGMT